MSDEHKPEAPTPPSQIPVFRSTRYQEVYANAVRFKVTPIDFTMALGTTPDIPGAPPGVMQDEAAIILTHSFLKVLSRHLNAIVEAVEQALGPIRIEEKNNPQQENIAAMVESLRATTFIE
jgi:hypothetical protein